MLFDFDRPLYSFFSLFFHVILPITLIFSLVNYFFFGVQDKNEIEDGLHIGTVADKKIVNADKNIFYSSDRRYQIVIEFEYEYRGKKHECERTVDVDYEVYISYDIGDEFDTYNPVVNDRKEVLK